MKQEIILERPQMQGSALAVEQCVARVIAQPEDTDAVGNNAQWMAPTGASYATVDEIPPNTTDYNGISATGTFLDDLNMHNTTTTGK